MTHIFSGWQLGQRLLAVLCAGLIGLVGAAMVAVQPSYAQIPLNSQEVAGQTKAELTGRQKGDPLSPEERLDRAYSISEAAGMREEIRQQKGISDPEQGNRPPVEAATDALVDLID